MRHAVSNLLILSCQPNEFCPISKQPLPLQADMSTKVFPETLVALKMPFSSDYVLSTSSTQIHWKTW